MTKTKFWPAHPNFQLVVFLPSNVTTMPQGCFNAGKAVSVPAQNPLYPATRVDFSDTDMLRVQYYTSAEAIKHLIPDDFDLEDEPLVTASLFYWGYSPFGAYSELVSTVEVKWAGVKYDFALELILDNEGALFMGREQLGVPKVIGKVVFDPSSTPRQPGYQLGYVERPFGHKIIEFGFKPEKKIHGLKSLDLDPNQKAILALRILPHLHNDKPPVIREYVAIQTVCTEGELWSGTGSVGFAPLSGFSLLTQAPVLRYAESLLLRKSSHFISEDLEAFSLGTDVKSKIDRAANGQAER